VIIVLNGPLGIGKSTLAEALSESIDQCVMLDGDHLVAGNPPFADELEHLHSTVALLVAHHQRFGYRHFVLNHLWTSAADLSDLRARLAGADTDIHCFRLTLSTEENLSRINQRASVKALDEHEFERHTFLVEREMLNKSIGDELGVPFDVSAPPFELVHRMLKQIGL
jgi:hypothetical protein